MLLWRSRTYRGSGAARNRRRPRAGSTTSSARWRGSGPRRHPRTPRRGSRARPPPPPRPPPACRWPARGPAAAAAQQAGQPQRHRPPSRRPGQIGDRPGGPHATATTTDQADRPPRAAVPEPAAQAPTHPGRTASRSGAPQLPHPGPGPAAGSVPPRRRAHLPPPVVPPRAWPVDSPRWAGRSLPGAGSLGPVSRETWVGRHQRGNPVRIRSCPAAVSGNDSRHRGANRAPRSSTEPDSSGSDGR
jgi:hypothetical protein